MRLLHLIHTPRHSGAEMLVHDLCRWHGTRGHDCAVASFTPPQPEFLETARNMERCGASLFFPGTSRTKLGRTAHFHDVVRRFRPNAVFGHSSLPSLYGRFATGWGHGRRPFVSVLHACDDFADPALRLVERLSRFRVDQVVAVADAAAGNYVRRFGSDIPVRTIANGIDISRFNGADRPSARRKLNLGAGRRVALQVGRICNEKQQILTLAALRPLLARGDVELWFAGLTDDPACEERLRQTAAQHGVADAVSFLGSRTDVPDLLAAADLFMMPSQEEAQGIALLEALASGIPIVASDIPVFAFAHGMPTVSLCSVGNTDAWTNAAAEMLAVPRVERDLSEFSMERTAQAYLEIAEKVGRSSP